MLIKKFRTKFSIVVENVKMLRAAWTENVRKLRNTKDNIRQWNMQGLSTKLNKIINEMESPNVHMAKLIETRRKGRNSINLKDSISVYWYQRQKAQQGVFRIM